MGLRITQDVFSRIVDMIEAYRADPYKEVECKVEAKLDYYQFQRALHNAINTFRSRANDQGTVLDINAPSRVRTTISDMKDILEFCKSGVIPAAHASAIKKKREDKIMIDGYGFSLKSSSEKPANVPIRADEESDMRLKKRVSVITPCKNFRADFTVVKEAKAADVVNLIKNKTSVKYEIELEIIQDREDETDVKIVARSMLEAMTHIMKAVRDVEILISDSDALAVIKEYMSVVYPDVPFESVNLSNIRQLKSYFAGPQPVTLERFHFRADGPVSLFNPNSGGYSVTLKADGERHLLFVDGRGRGFLINNRLTVKDAGITVPAFKSSLFDVELVTTKTRRRLILIFDTYLNGNEKVYQSDLPSRLAVAKAFAKAAKDDSEFYAIEAKTFVMSELEGRSDISIYSATQKVLGLRETVDFKTDGVIYTPIKLPVGGSNPGDYSGFPASKTWKHVMKWKPSEDNTIDFLVRIRKDGAGRDLIQREEGGLGMHKTLDLFVGKNATWTTPPEFYSGNAKVHFGYGESRFDVDDMKGVATMHVNDDGLMMIGGTEILDESVVEMRYDVDSEQWVPLRVRLDKTEAYKSTRSIRGTANDFTVAESIWRTIVNPITEANISIEAQRVIPTDVDMADTYYDQDDESDKRGAMRAMRFFHNVCIKDQQLIARFKGRATSLFDLACGRGGDLRKWIDAGMRVVLGLDLAQNNISRGALSRLIKKMGDRFKRPPFPLNRYVFLPFDTSIPITPKTIKEIKDEGLRDLTSVVWGLKEPSSDRQRQIAGIATMRFDVVSCQFAVHYFFKDQVTLDGFIHNIVAHIKEGGYFIGTCLDGQAVDEAFASAKSDVISGQKDGNVIWRLKKQYKDRFNGADLGVKITAQVESISGESFEEYLVGFDRLVSELEKVGIVLLEEKDLSTLGLESSTGKFDELYTGEVEKMIREGTHGSSMSEDEKRYSFMGRWFIFKKTSAPRKTNAVTDAKSKVVNAPKKVEGDGKIRKISRAKK